MVGRTRNTFLGLAVSDHAVTCAELAAAGGSGRSTVRRTATFVFPAELSLDTPDAAGQALAAFLRQNKFSSTRAIVGVPAKWLVAVEKELPPADDQQARAALRLQAERLAVAESGEVVFDFAGQSSNKEPTRVLLVGMLKQRLDKVERLMDAAGMNVIAVTSTGLAMASAAARHSTDGGMLSLAQGGGELVWRAGGGPRMLRHIPLAINGHDVKPTTPLGGELRRMIAMAPTNGTVASRSVVLLDGVGLEPSQVSELSDRLGVPVRAATPAEALGVETAAINAATLTAPGAPPESINFTTAGRFAPAMALALTGAEPHLLAVDFKHSRLAPPRIRRISARALLGIALAMLLAVGIASLFWIVHQRQTTLDELNAELSALKGRITEARGVVDRYNYGSGFFPVGRPPALDCLRELTLAFRDNDRIWTTSVTFRENGKGTFAGKASDQRTVTDLLDRMRRNPRFSDVKVLDIREADPKSREVTFSASFTFN